MHAFLFLEILPSNTQDRAKLGISEFSAKNIVAQE